jgi:hypothetical protein
VNDHHLVMGRLIDFITGRSVDDTHDERYRQKIARLLVDEKGYEPEDVLTGRSVTVRADNKRACVPVTFIVKVEEREAMLVHYGPGSLVTRHRPALALARLAATYQIPVVVVTNGEAADILDGASGKIKASGLARIPSREQLIRELQDHSWPALDTRRADMESRIVMAYEVDDRCPCDDSVCRLDGPAGNSATDKQEDGNDT